MNQERFESNFLIPVLREMEETLPKGYEDELQRRFVGYIHAIELTADLGTLPSNYKWNFLYILRVQKGICFCAIAFKHQRDFRILNFICTHYKKQRLINSRLRDFTPYLERIYLAEDAWKDKTFYEKIIQTTIGQLLKASIGFLAEMENQRDNNQNEFQKLLENYQNISISFEDEL